MAPIPMGITVWKQNMNIEPGYIRVQIPTSPQEGIKPASAQKSPSQQAVQSAAPSGAEAQGPGRRAPANKGDADKVSLSPEGMEKQAEEAGGAEPQGGGSLADAVIAKLKEQIAAVKQQLEALAGKDGVGEQKKMLQDKIAILNSALLSAMSEQVQA